MKTTPKDARAYLFFGLLLIALPSILSLYRGHDGKLLVATGALDGTYFEKTVIYIERHDFWRAVGVVINKPFREGDLETHRPKGPVEHEEGMQLRFMHGGPVPKDDSWIVLRGTPPALVAYSALWPVEDIPEIAVDERLFSGYSGWGIMQLDREIRRGDWGVIDYDPVLLFDTPVEDVWNTAIKRVLQRHPVIVGGV